MTTNTRGFTLIELLVVIAIIGILSSVVLTSVNSARTNANVARALSDFREIQKALEFYYDGNGRYPISSGWSGLYSCWGYQGTDWIPGLAPTYIGALSRSPNNSSACDKNYIYNSTGTNYKLIWHYGDGMSIVTAKYPSFIDPARPTYSYGIWTTVPETSYPQGATTW